MRTKEEYLELLNETVQYYKHHERGTYKGICMYRTPNGNMCAVGRCVEDIESVGDIPGDLLGLIDDLKDRGQTLDDVLYEQYRGFHTDFWFELQYLHDTSHFWTPNGNLTESGEAFKKSLEITIKTGTWEQ